jgi:hypothetical protein
MKKRVVLIGILAFLAVGQVQAQGEFNFFIGGYGPGKSLGAVDFNNGFLWGFRLGGAFLDFFGTEMSYTRLQSLDANTGFDSGSANVFDGNAYLQLPASNISPFATFGVGVTSGSTSGPVEINTSFTWNVGGGVKVRKVAGPLGLRFDVRYHQAINGLKLTTTEQEANFSFTEFSGGLMFSF